jgi:flagellar motor switch protein FliM
MASPLDPNEIEALMAAIQEGQVTPESSGSSSEAQGPVVPYDLTSQDRIIRGQMPTLDSINDRIASIFGRTLSGRTRMELRVTAAAASLMKFADVSTLLNGQNAVGVMSLGAGHGMALVIVEGPLAQALLAASLGNRKAKASASEARGELTHVEQVVLRQLLGLLSEAMATSWENVLPFKPQVMRFESDPRMAAIANPSDVTILCAFEVTGPIDGRLMLAIPYAAVESAKKALSSPPRLGGQRDARFGQALSRELEQVEVELRVEVGRYHLRMSDLLGLKVGDVVTLNTSEGSPLPVMVQERAKMTAMPKVLAGGIAVEILKAIPRPAAAAPAARPNRPAPQTTQVAA